MLNVIIMMLGAVEQHHINWCCWTLIIVKNDVEERHYHDVRCCWTDIITYIGADEIITYNDVEERQYHYDGIEQREERIMLSFIIT